MEFCCHNFTDLRIVVPRLVPTFLKINVGHRVVSDRSSLVTPSVDLVAVASDVEIKILKRRNHRLNV